MFTFRSNFDNEKKIWYGGDTQRLFHPDVSVGQVLLNMLNADDPQKIIQISDNNGIRITSEEMRLLMIRAANHFLEKGLQQEDVIGFITYNSHNIAPLVLASFLNGHTISCLDPQFNKMEIMHMFGITRPKLIFCDHHVYGKLKEALRKIQLDSPVFVLNGNIDQVGTVDEFLAPVDNELFFSAPKLRRGGEQIAAIVCSSGTTGLPKGVCISHEILLKEAFGTLKYNDVYLCFSSLYWFSGIMSLMHNVMYRCTRIITDKPFSPELMLRIIEQYKVTIVIASPTQVTEIVHSPEFSHRDLSSVKVFAYIGGAVPQVVIDAVQNRLDNGVVASGYGLTEIGGGCTVKLPFHKNGSAGHVTPNHQVKIIDDAGESLGINEKGEICIRTPYKSLKYYKDPKATKATFDSENWVHSGDIGFIDEDGCLFIVDRKKDIMKYKGYSLSPTEIESVIMAIPGVVKACVCGVFEDEIASDIPAAAVVKKENSNLTEADVCQYIAERMAEFKQLRAGVYFFKSLPVTPSGKVQRSKVQEILTNLYKNKKNSNPKL